MAPPSWGGQGEGRGDVSGGHVGEGKAGILGGEARLKM